MSKQLTLSAAISVFATAAFVLLATPGFDRVRDTGAANGFATPAFEVSLPTH